MPIDQNVGRRGPGKKSRQSTRSQTNAEEAVRQETKWFDLPRVGRRGQAKESRQKKADEELVKGNARGCSMPRPNATPPVPSSGPPCPRRDVADLKGEFSDIELFVNHVFGCFTEESQSPFLRATCMSYCLAGLQNARVFIQHSTLWMRTILLVTAPAEP
jgi:hypothetical protein